MDDDKLESLLEFHDLRVRTHGEQSAEEALRKDHPSEADEVLAEYRRRIGEPLRVVRGLVRPGHESWYLPKPDGKSPRWAFARARLGLPDEVVERTGEVADEILARLDNPVGSKIESRGLVLGHVQSGKTTSFLSVAAKAADNGYHLIIILAGVHNSLRRQTQDRAARTLVHNPALWWLGTTIGDFKPDGNPLESHISGNGKRGLLVVKKNATVLEKLAKWLEDEEDPFLRKHAILVIDDEADQAGLDVGSGAELEGVHKQLHRIVNLKTSDGNRRCAYLAYTATPYANILTSQDEYGLYPRDFIYPLDKPSVYVGPAELFGDKAIGRPIQMEEADGASVLTEGLRDALCWFVCATAARVALGEPLDSFHSSMLIHTSQKTEEQLAYQPVIQGFFADLREKVAHDRDHLRSLYERILAEVPSGTGGADDAPDEPRAAWTEVREHVPAVLERIVDKVPAGAAFVEDGHEQIARSGVIVDNSKVDWRDRLTYSDIDNDRASVTVVVIGGNTLSRGLTLEGLVSSYFVRTARTYDTLMQMGRWFGYRPGYRHLVRIWTTPTLLDWFRELTEVEEELREELTWMQDKGLAPSDYGPRIRVSPHLNITRASAMRSVKMHLSYSDTQIDPAWIDIELQSIEHNQQIARELADGLDPYRSAGSPHSFEGVPAAGVRRLIERFRFHELEKRVDPESLRRYLDEEADHLSHWNVSFKSVAGTGERFDFGGAVGEVTTVIRARSDTEPKAHIQSVVDSDDHRLDLGPLPNGSLARFRARSEPPLLVVYAIDRTSPPRGKRVALNAPATPISIAIVLPASDSTVEYVAPALATDVLDQNDDGEGGPG